MSHHRPISSSRPVSSSHSSSSFGSRALVSSSVTPGSSRSNAEPKGLNTAFRAKTADPTTNRYKYRGFNKRIQDIRLNFRALLDSHEQSAADELAASRIEAATMLSSGGLAGLNESFSSAELSSADARGAHSYFLTKLEQFSATNLHIHFLTFLSEIRGLVASFPLLLKNQAKVVDILLKHAAVPQSEAQMELFTLMSVLARDLRGEFLPYFGVVMKTLLSLLDPSDAANIQAIFQTLASLFRYTARQVAEKVETIFEEYYLELLGHHKSYIRHFASESLAFLLRTAEKNGQQPESIVNALLRYAPERDIEAFKDGLASTLFESVKNIQFNFQANHIQVVTALLKPLKVGGVQGDFAADVITRFHRRMANYTRKEQAKPIWKLLLERLQKRQGALTAVTTPAALQSSEYQLRTLEAARLLVLIELWSSHRGGSRIPSDEAITSALNLAFGPLFSQREVCVEWKRTAASMLTKYWKNRPHNFGSVVAPHLETLLSLPVTNVKKTEVDAIGIENATLLLAFLEGARDLQSESGVLEKLTRKLIPSIESLLLLPSSTPALQATARSIGLALLFELNYVHPLGSAYAIQPLEELHRVPPSPAAQRLAKRRKEWEAKQASGEEGDAEEPMPEDLMDLTEEENEDEENDVIEEEVDSASYLTPLPQPSFFLLSPHNLHLLRLTPKLQTYLLQHILTAIKEDYFSADNIAHSHPTHGSTLILGQSTLIQRISLVWTALQLLPSSGVDVAASVDQYLPSSSSKKQRSSSITIADTLTELISILTKRLEKKQSKIFTAATPIDSNTGGEEPSSETNHHLLVAHQTFDQLLFLRSQTIMTLAQLMELRFSGKIHEEKSLKDKPLYPNATAASFPLQTFLQTFIVSTMEAYRQTDDASSTHIANLSALDRVFQMAKQLQLDLKQQDGVVGVADVETKQALSKFFDDLFGRKAFLALSPFFLPNLSSAHSFLRSGALSIFRYFTKLRFTTEGAKNEDDMDTSNGNGAGNRSELVGECPILDLMYEVSILQPTLENEKDYIRILKEIEVKINSGRVPDPYMRLIPSFLLGLLHLKLNPLWIHIQKILCSSFINRYCVTPERQQWIWDKVLLVKLNEISERTRLEVEPKLEEESEGDEQKMDTTEDDAPIKPVTSTACIPTQSPILLRFSHFVSLTSRSTDSFTYQTLLYACFALEKSGVQTNTITVTTNGFSKRIIQQKHVEEELTRRFIQDVWLSEWLRLYPNTLRVEEGFTKDDQKIDLTVVKNTDAIDGNELAFYEQASSTSAPTTTGLVHFRPGSRKLVKQKVLQFLKLFLVCFHKVNKKLFNASRLQNVFLTLLANNEEDIQKLALSCLAKFQLPYLTPYITQLQGLIAESTWRDTMTTFSLSPESGLIAPEHRLHFAAILIRIVYPRLTQRQSGKSSKAQGLSQRRAAVLGFLGGLSHQELQHLVAMVMGGPFRKIINILVKATEAHSSKPTQSTLADPNSIDYWFDDILANQIPILSIGSSTKLLEQVLLDPRLYAPTSPILIPTSKQVGFLHMLQFFLSKLKTLSIPYLKFFIIQLTYMILNAEIQIEKRKGQISAQETAESKQVEDEKMEETEEKKDVDDESDGEDVDLDEDENEDADEDDEEKDEEDDENKEDEEKSESKKASGDDDLILPGIDEEAEIPSSRSKTEKKKSTTPYVLQKYLSELREIRQLAFSRMATILEQYPQLFKPDTKFKELAPPKGLQEEEQTMKYDGPSLAPYLQFFLAVSWPSLTRLSQEGTQHMGGLWSSMLHLSSHHYLAIYYLKDFPVLRMNWSDAINKTGVSLQLQNASSFVTSSPFPLFTLVLDSLGARSVHSSVVGAVLSISESLLRAREDAADWLLSKQAMEELEADRKKTLDQLKQQKKRGNTKMKSAVAPIMNVRVFRDESSDDEEDDETRNLSQELVRIETQVLNPKSFATNARQFWFAQFSAELRAIWEVNVDKYLSQMHKWISHLAGVHKANNGRKMLATGSAPTTQGKAAQRRGGPRQTFFPRRELEVLSQIAGFATSEITAKKLIDLLLPFLHSPEKQHLLLNLHDRSDKKRSKHMLGAAQIDRYKPAPTLHHTILTILLSLVPLLPSADIETVLDTMQRLLFSLKNHRHRSLLSELYGLVGSGSIAKKEKNYSFLPLLSRTIQSLNAMNARRIEEYDDARRLEVYSALDLAFHLQLLQREIKIMETEGQDQMDESLTEELEAKLNEAKAQLVEVQRQVAAASAASQAPATTEGHERITVDMLQTLFKDYFSPLPDAHARALATLRPLFYQLIHDLLDEDLGTRSSSSSLLKKVIQFLSLPHANAPTKEEGELSRLPDTPPFISKPGHLFQPSSLLTSILYPLLKHAIKTPIDKVRREVVMILRQLFLTFPRFYRTYLILIDTDPEKDFLENIVSIQIHARRKALTRLYQKITVQDQQDPNLFHAHASKAVDLQVITHIILPLLHHFIYDPASSHNVGSAAATGTTAIMSSGAHSGSMSNSKQIQRAHAEGTLLEESIKLASKLAAYMPWSTYFHTIQSYLKLISAKPALERTLVRVICGFIREWHFEVEETEEERQLTYEADLRKLKAEHQQARKEERERRERERALRGENGMYDEEEPAEEEIKVEELLPKPASFPPPSPLSQRIRSTLSKRLLPQLHGLLTGHKIKASKIKSSKKDSTKGMLTTYENQNELTSKSGMAGGDGSKETGTMELVRVPVAMALVALLRQLPRTIFHEEFPRLLTKLCIQLQHREQQARDLTRSTLLEILALLGPYYFNFFLEELSRHLVNGYQIHVLGQMVWACLDTLVNKMRVAPGAIDHSLIKLMDILMNDLLGEPAKQKEIAAIRAATKEARINHSQDSFQLLSQIISFPGSIHYLIDPFRFKLAHDSTLRLKELGIIADTLKRISVGLHANPSVQTHLPELLIYIHTYLFKNVSESFAALFPTSATAGKLSKQDKKANAANKNRYRKLDLTAEQAPMEQLREENKMRSEGKTVGGGLAQRKAMEFLMAIQSSEANQSEFERTRAKAKPSKDETYLLVQPAPTRETFDSNAIAKGHHSNLILVFGLNLLYYTLKNKRLNTGSSIESQAVDPQQLSPEVIDNVSRLDPFLHLIRDYCLVMGSELTKDQQAGTRTSITKEGEKKIQMKTQATSSSAVIHVALKCSEYLLQIPSLPSRNAYLRDLCNYMFSLIHSKPSPQVLSICYRNLSVILKQVGDWKICGITEAKQKVMLHFIKSEVLATTVTQATSVAFKLLQSILSRTIELEELYDLIITVSQLMVTSSNEEIQKSCSSAVYTFLYNYKLGAQRLQTHFGFLLNQLSYPHASGRAVVLNLLQSIFAHFHPTVLEEQLEFFFLPLVQHMVNETNTSNKKLCADVISVLLSKISKSKQDEVMKIIYGWWSEDSNTSKSVVKKAKRDAASSLLQFAALQLIGLMIDLLKQNYKTYLTATLHGLTKILDERLAELETAQDDEVNTEDAEEQQVSDSNAAWRVLYTALLSFEKLFQYLPPDLLLKQFQSIYPQFFQQLLACLLYPHTWVRNVAGRIVGFILASIPIVDFSPANARAKFSNTLLANPSLFFLLTKNSTVQLQSAHLTDALAEQIIKNLVWISIVAEKIGPGKIWEGLEGDQLDEEEKEEEEATEEKDDEEETKDEDEEEPMDEDVEMAEVEEEETKPTPSKKSHKSLTPASSTSITAKSTSAEDQQFPKSDNRILNWLFTRLSYMCRRDEGIMMRNAIFRYFATMASQLPVSTFSCFLLQVLYPLYRLSTGQVRPEEVELQTFSNSVLELIQTSVGTPLFMSAYSTIRTRIQSVRQARQSKKKQLSVLRPDLAAQRKQSKHDAKRVAKKRKIQVMKMGRGTGKTLAASQPTGHINTDLNGFTSTAAATPTSTGTVNKGASGKKRQKL